MKEWSYSVLPSRGTKFITKNEIASANDCEGFFVRNKYITSRKAGVNCTYLDFVPGSGGDIWWMEHEDGTVGAYMCTEVWVDEIS
jgi:hypothetical protein